MPTVTAPAIHPLAGPLRVDQQGVLRVGPTRVTLDSLVAAYQSGLSAEEIAEQYPSLALADVYAALAQYLRQRVELDRYLAARAQQAVEVAQRVGGGDSAALRARLVTRRGRAAG